MDAPRLGKMTVRWHLINRRRPAAFAATTMILRVWRFASKTLLREPNMTERPTIFAVRDAVNRLSRSRKGIYRSAETRQHRQTSSRNNPQADGRESEVPAPAGRRTQVSAQIQNDPPSSDFRLRRGYGAASRRDREVSLPMNAGQRIEKVRPN